MEDFVVKFPAIVLGITMLVGLSSAALAAFFVSLNDTKFKDINARRSTAVSIGIAMYIIFQFAAMLIAAGAVSSEYSSIVQENVELKVQLEKR